MEQQPHEGTFPLARFICHKTDRKAARDAITKIAAGADDKETAAALNNLPLETLAGVLKNHLVGMSPENDPVFAIHIKNGRPAHPERCILKSVAS